MEIICRAIQSCKAPSNGCVPVAEGRPSTSLASCFYLPSRIHEASSYTAQGQKTQIPSSSRSTCHTYHWQPSPTRYHAPSISATTRSKGPIIYLQLGEIPTVVVSSARLAKEVLKTHDLALASRPQLFAAKHLFYNCTNVGFSPYGAYWRNIRKICILELLSARRVQTCRSVREEEVARLVSWIAESSLGTVDLTKLLGLYANDVVCRIAFGRDFSEGGDYHQRGIQKMLEEYQVLLGGFSIGDFFPSLEFMHSLTGMKARLVDTFRRFDHLFDQILSEHVSSNETEEHNKDLVDVLLEVQRNDFDEMPLTTDNIKAIILVSEASIMCLLLSSVINKKKL